MSVAPDDVVRDFLTEVWDRGRSDAAGNYVAPSYEVPGVGRGPAAVATNARTFRDAFPDLRLAVDDVVVEDERVAVWMLLSGTHLGPFRGHEATGRHAVWNEVGFFEVQDGVVVRGRFLADMFALRKALGIIPDDVR